MTVTREELQNLNSEYSFLIETNLKDKDQDSILRLGFWAKDNQDKIRQVLEDRLNQPTVAKEMYEALQNIYNALHPNGGGYVNDDIIKIEQAISKYEQAIKE